MWGERYKVESPVYCTSQGIVTEKEIRRDLSLAADPKLSILGTASYRRRNLFAAWEPVSVINQQTGEVFPLKRKSF